MKPTKQLAPLEVGWRWGDDGAIYQEKLDGRFSIFYPEAGAVEDEQYPPSKTNNNVGAQVLAGELMSSGQFIAFDCLRFEGADVRGLPLVERLRLRESLCARFGVAQVPSTTNGGELLREVLERGGEGIVRKLPGSSWFDAMTACKRLQTWVCRVRSLSYATGAAKISDATTGEDRGTVPLRNRVTQCRIGSLVKVEGLELHAGGAIRDPRPCKDSATSWLVTF